VPRKVIVFGASCFISSLVFIPGLFDAKFSDAKVAYAKVSDASFAAGSGVLVSLLIIKFR
jgi:hypothetical protein